MLRWWKRNKEVRQATDLFLQSLISSDDITKEQAMAIPSIAQCVDVISSIAAILPVCLYRDKGDHVELVDDDPRVFLLNEESGNLLDSFQMKKAWVEDYLLDGIGYLYINRERNSVKSIHYIDSRYVSVLVGTDPIFKTADIMVNGTTYRDFEFVRLVRRTKDGVTGQGIVSQNNGALAVMYNALQYENYLVKTGGNKKGILKSQETLSPEAMDILKGNVKKFYSSTNADAVFILNKGMEFQEASNTSVDMQLNENKKTNVREACKIFSMPPSILDGTATDEEWSLTMKICINPILKAMEAAFNQELLLESEKHPGGNGGCFYFAIDTKELLKGDILKRFQAYQLAVESNFMQIDEVRYREDLPSLNLDFIKLGLQDVLYNPETKEVYTPNTNQTTNLHKPGEPNKPVLECEGSEPKRTESVRQEEIAKISLNSAQISSILEIVRAVGAGEMDLDSAITLLTTAFPFEEQDARRILGNPKALAAKGGEGNESRNPSG